MPSRPPRGFVWTGYLAFTMTGIYVSAIGPGLPGLAARTHIPLSQAGTLLTALFVGGLITSAAAGRALDRYGRRPVIIAGSLANGLGCVLLPLATSWPQALAAGVLLGTGDGMLVVGWHVLFVDLYPDGAGAALSRINVFFGAGAFIGPALAAASIGVSGDIRYALWLAAAGQALTASIVLRQGMARTRGAHAANEPEGLRLLARAPLMWTLGALLAVYVAAEVGIGAWTFTYLHKHGAYSVDAASLVASAYWLSLTAGRALSPFVLRRTGDRALLLLAAAVTAAGGLGLTAMAGWYDGGAACILILGLAYGPIWPLTIAVGSTSFPRAAGAVSGLLATAGSIGGIAGPWLQGVLLGGGVYSGMSFAFGTGLLMAVLAAAVFRMTTAAREGRNVALASS